MKPYDAKVSLRSGAGLKTYTPSAPVFWCWDSPQEALEALPAQVAIARLSDVVAQQSAVRSVLSKTQDWSGQLLEEQLRQLARARMCGQGLRVPTKSRVEDPRLRAVKSAIFELVESGGLKDERATAALIALRSAEQGDFSHAQELGLLP